MKNLTSLLFSAALAVAPLIACGQSPPAVPPAQPSIPAPSLVGPVSVAPEARAILKILQDRKETLKDFTAAIDYSTDIADIHDISGKRGALNFIIDPARGPIFTVDFTEDTANGKPKRKHHQQVIFDGKEVTTKDFDPKEIMHANMLPAGAKPGDAVSLNGPLTLPIGLDVEDVIRNFDVTLRPSKDPNQAVLKLVPRAAGGAPTGGGVPPKFDFTALEITVDKKLELPVKLVQTEKSRDVTTITLSNPVINQGQAKMESTATPPGWNVRK